MLERQHPALNSLSVTQHRLRALGACIMRGAWTFCVMLEGQGAPVSNW